MAGLVWDDVGDRVYESGLDHGVLYLPNGLAVPWNGLTSIVEHFDKEVTPVYYDGKKINDLVTLGSFSASMRAITYPDEFVELEGAAYINTGALIGDQLPQVFGLCYRTKIGNDIDADAGYKIHIIYNVTAMPNDKEYSTLTDDPNLAEFEWTITAIPEEISGFRPTAYICINSLDIEPFLLEFIESMLYGSSNTDANLIPLSILVDFITGGYSIMIIDHGDGSWTAYTEEGLITFPFGEDYIFQITDTNATYVGTTFTVSSSV